MVKVFIGILVVIVCSIVCVLCGVLMLMVLFSEIL